MKNPIRNFPEPNVMYIQLRIIIKREKQQITKTASFRGEIFEYLWLMNDLNY